MNGKRIKKLQLIALDNGDETVQKQDFYKKDLVKKKTSMKPLDTLRTILKLKDWITS